MLYWLFYNLQGSTLPAVELDNAIWFGTLSRMSGILCHSSKWVWWFCCFFQCTSGLGSVTMQPWQTLTVRLLCSNCIRGYQSQNSGGSWFNRSCRSQISHRSSNQLLQLESVAAKVLKLLQASWSSNQCLNQ